MVNASAQWRVEVVAIATGEVVRSIPCEYERKAEKVDAGLTRQLDHARFFTRIVAPGEVV